MRHRVLSTAIVALLIVAAGGCSSASKPATVAPAKGHRTIAEGYSLLYAIASQQRKIDKVLLVKVESDELGAFVDELATYMGELSTQLEDLSKRYPALTLETQFLPEVEVRARESIASETTQQLLAKNGREFERTLLFSQRSALDSEYHIAAVMVDLETAAERRDFWIRTEKRLGELRSKVDRLLERHHCSTRGRALRVSSNAPNATTPMRNGTK